MEITRQRFGEVVEVELTGRLDGYWCDHLSTEIAEVLREGHHHIRVDCSQVTYLTSAGIGVLVRFYKELARINGSFQVVHPSAAVQTVLRITRVDQFLLAATADAAAPPRPRPTRRMDDGRAAFDVFDVNPQAVLTCRAIGSPAPLAAGAFEEAHCTTFGEMVPALAVGVGAFGSGFADCRARFGELISVAGATAYQPGDGTNVPDYLLASGLGSDVRVLYGLACEGGFTHLLRFEMLRQGESAGLSRLADAAFGATGARSVGMVVVAEAAGLTGAALRTSPAYAAAGGFFAHPAIRTRLTFTAEQAFPRSLVLAAGVATRDPAPGSAQLRTIGPGVTGHFHAAAFRFRPLRKGAIELHETVTALFEPEQLLGVLHLLRDDRARSRSAESEFTRGACWVGPIAGGLAHV